MKTILSSLFFLFLTLTLSGQEARNIIEKSHNVVKVSSFEAVSTLTITDNRGNERVRQNTMASKTLNDGTEKRIIKFISPAEVKGTGILIYDYENQSDDMWIYLPALRKTRRIVSSDKSNSFMGSEFSNSDISAPSLDDFSYTLLGSEKIEESDCWKIAVKPVNVQIEDEYGYGRAIRWIGKNDYIVRKTDYYDFDDQLFKTIRTVSFKKLDQANGKYMVTGMFAENYDTGRSSLMKMNQVQIAETSDEYFTISYLER